jgi:hypothetical protein
MTTEDLIGAEVIDALDGSFIELRLPDGRIVTLDADVERGVERFTNVPWETGVFVITDRTAEAA